MDSDLIVLNLTKLGESSVVLHTLSRDYGRKSFVVKVSRKTPMSQFLPLNILEADVTESTRTTLWRAGRVTVKQPLNGIRSNIYKNTMTLFMSEVTPSRRSQAAIIPSFRNSSRLLSPNPCSSR